VSDIERSIEFYRDKVGFNLDHDAKNEHMHVVQLTPRRSGCSIVFGDLPVQNEMAPGSMRGLQLVVADAHAARQELLDRGVEVSDIMVFDERDGGTPSASATRLAIPGPCKRSRSAVRSR
jgi:catechol 2,3-dioxygenase-like lactoylglutathione lyase family enzyme